MNVIRKILFLLVWSIFISMFATLVITQTAHAVADFTIQDNATGGQCNLIGTWDVGSKTCTLNQDISITGINNGIEVMDNNITVNGADHWLMLNTTLAGQQGIKFISVNGGTVKNLNVKGFDIGVFLQSSMNVDIFGVRAESNYWGLYWFNSDASTAANNTIVANTDSGLRHFSSDNNRVYYNNFINNINDATVGGTSTGNIFNTMGGGNYWDKFDTEPEGCINTAFNLFCDGPHTVYGMVTDPQPFVLRDAWTRHDWTWYDNVGGDNWVLLALPNTVMGTAQFTLDIANQARMLPSLPGLQPGQVPPGDALTPKYDGLIGGPVKATNLEGSFKITSQRVLWPKGGDSLEELAGTPVQRFDSRMLWTWYDQASPGFKNWVLVSNPNNYQINYNVLIAGSLVDTGTIPANGRVTPSFPGVIGGPVEVNAWNSFGNPVYIMASQRVLINNDMAFNEQPGLSASQLANHWVWTWYDEASAGAQNWVLVANPPGAAGPIYYEIWIGGTKVMDGGPIPVGGNETPTFPGMIGGPVEVRSFVDAAHTVGADCIASQRIIWGPSFGEVLGTDNAALVDGYNWTWYDEASAGARNWVLVANPPNAAGPLYYEVWIAGTKFMDGGPIAPGGNETPTFPGVIGGPVQVRSYADAAHTVAANSIASQRVLWNGYFNEVWGQ